MRFRRACKRFIFVENLGTDAVEQAVQSDASQPAPRSNGDGGNVKEQPSKVVPLVIQAMNQHRPGWRLVFAGAAGSIHGQRPSGV